MQTSVRPWLLFRRELFTLVIAVCLQLGNYGRIKYILKTLICRLGTATIACRGSTCYPVAAVVSTTQWSLRVRTTALEVKGVGYS